MPTYIQLLTLTPEGKEKAWRDPRHVRRTEQAMATSGVEMLGVYGVLGPWDFVIIVEAPTNEAAARFSMELGVRVGAHVTTLPAIPVGRLEADEPMDAMAAAGLEMEMGMGMAQNQMPPGYRGPRRNT